MGKQSKTSCIERLVICGKDNTREETTTHTSCIQLGQASETVEAMMENGRQFLFGPKWASAILSRNTQVRFDFFFVFVLSPFSRYIRMGKWLRLVCLRRLFVLVSSRKDCPTDSKDATPSLPVHLDLPGIVMSLSELQVWQPEFTSSQIQSTEKHNSRQFQTKQTSKNQPCQQSKHNSQQTHRATPRLVWI